MRVVFGREVVDSKLEKPFRLIIGGGSGCGKTTILKEIVDKSHFSSPFDKIVYCYPDYLEEIPIEFDQIVEYHAGICDAKYFSSLPKNTLLLFDDMMTECGKSDEIMKLFSVIARKKNISIIFLVQNIYDQSRQFRNIRLNATSFILFKFFAANDVNNRILRDIGADQLVPKSLLDKVYSKNFGYIFVNFHPNRHSEFETIRTNIFEPFFKILYKMEYIAIPKAEFIKHFKILEAKKGSVRAIKNEIEIRKTKRSRNNAKKQSSTKRSKRKNSESSSQTTDNSTQTESE
jgi:hypothetical protein|tara:strand:+ start:1075 stop:1941 length:867 start_codon:yes stop_codon:yes gene_type:complete